PVDRVLTPLEIDTVDRFTTAVARTRHDFGDRLRHLQAGWLRQPGRRRADRLDRSQMSFGSDLDDGHAALPQMNAFTGPLSCAHPKRVGKGGVASRARLAASSHATGR